jgi:hypothetical protein
MNYRGQEEGFSQRRAERATRERERERERAAASSLFLADSTRPIENSQHSGCHVAASAALSLHPPPWLFSFLFAPTRVLSFGKFLRFREGERERERERTASARLLSESRSPLRSTR